MAEKFNPKKIDKAIQTHLPKLRKDGVLAVRPGYEIAGHQLTGKQAIVATVHTKKKNLPRDQMLPDKIGSIPVDVREANGYQRLRSHDPAAAALTQTYGRPEDEEPSWPYEREMPSGKLLQAKSSRTQKSLKKKMSLQQDTKQALASHATKQQITYVPAKASLDPVITTATITAHVSPDAGLVNLQKFLQATEKSLVIGMYDFTSGQILQTFEKVLDGTKTLKMVLDNPAPNPTRDQTDTQTVEDLNQQLGKRSQIARALDRSDVYAAEWMFPYAYHIKVIVRDGDTFWLSSGNLNNSNQPDLASPPHTEDRDWHIIIEDEQLAGVFEAFLNQDFASAEAHQASAPSTSARAVSDAFAKLAGETNPPPPPLVKAPASTTFPAQTFSNINVKITPLLTPDDLGGDATKGQYLTNILQLIASAQRTLYIQLQYIEASKAAGDYQALLTAIADRVKAGVDVRLIQSLQYGEKWAEQMKTTGVDLTANIALQSNVHNKGFVVDSQIAVVSSQNFSPAGIRQNRDAGVIIENPQIAQYFEKIFLSDWQNKAKPFAPRSTTPSEGSSPRTRRARPTAKNR